MKAIIFVCLSVLCGNAFGAEASVAHTMVVKSAYAKVVSVLALKRPVLVQATGASILQTKGNLFKIGCDRAEFWVKETKDQVSPSRLVVTWSLASKNRDIKAYKSVIDCYTCDKGTTVRGSIQCRVGDGMLGSRKLDDHVQRGVEQMQGELKRLLGEN
jgi:hypothetical protein